MRIGTFILLFSSLCAAQTARPITAKYSNPSLGYEVTIPEGLVGAPDEQAGAEKGFTLTLPSGGTVSVSGEPNTLGWKAPIDGIRHSLGVEKCDSTRQQATGFMRMGRLTATKGTVVCADRFVEMVLSFHPGGAPIYWITLRTTAQKRAEDEAVFYRLATSFGLISGQ